MRKIVFFMYIMVFGFMLEIANGQTVPDGDYYINNKETGDYLYCDYSYSAKAKSGLIVNYGNWVRWHIKYVDSYYVIYSVYNGSEFLGVSYASGQPVVSYQNASLSSVPNGCRWDITVAANGGMLIKNKSNNYYLNTSNEGLFVTSSLGSAGTTTYNRNVWRLLQTSYLPTRELKADADFFKSSLVMGSTCSAFFRSNPENAVWTDKSDFILSGYNTGIVTIDSQWNMTPVSTGTTTVTCKHKVTDRTYTFTVVVNPATNNRGTLSTWYTNETNEIGRWTYSPYMYVEVLDSSTGGNMSSAKSHAISQWSTALSRSINLTPTEQNAEIIVYSGTKEQMAAKGVYLSAITDGVAYTNYSYDGYYTFNSKRKALCRYTSAKIGIYTPSGQSMDTCKHLFTHELGHAMGYLGHTYTPTDVMYKYTSTYTSLSSLEKII